MPLLLCLDFSNLIIRHAVVQHGQHRDLLGRPTWGAVGAIAQSLRLIEEHRPDHLLVAQDCSRENSFRRELSDGYKAHRPDADEDMTRQFKLAYETLGMLSWPVLRVDRHEADDVIASAAASYPAKVLIVTGDKDMLALVSDRVQLWMFRHGGPELVGPPGCRRIMGVEPRQVRDYKSLVGDTSDGISGVEGIGPKRALKLLEAYGSVASVYRHLDGGGEITVVTPAVVRKLIAGREQARLSYRLAGLVQNLPIDIAQLACPPRPVWDEVKDPLARLGMDGLERAITGRSAATKSGPVDLDRAFEQLSF